MFGCSYVFRCDINYPLEGRNMEYVIGVILTLAVAALLLSSVLTVSVHSIQRY